MDYFRIQVFIMEGDLIDTTGTAFHGVDWDVGDIPLYVYRERGYRTQRWLA